MKYLIIFLILISCSNPQKKTESIITTQEEFNDLSIYQIPSNWNTQNGDSIQFKNLNGNVLAVVMIYTSCQVACPRLVADMRNIHDQVSIENVKYVLVSIDPNNDTPERLKEFAIENEMTGSEWLFLQGNEETVRELANILAVRYNQINPIDFSHSNIISVFDKSGVLQHQQEGLGVDYQETIDKIKELGS